MTDSLTVYDFDPRNLPPEYLRAIGLFVAVSAQTENCLKDFVGSLLGIDNIQTIALATHMNIPLKMDIIRTLAELDAPNIAEMDKVDDLLDAIKSAFEERNVAVHNLLAIHPTTKEVFSYSLKARGKLRSELIPISIAEIEKSADKMYEAGMGLIKFMLLHGLEPIQRTKPIRESVKRTKQARTERLR
jgi:hypothetical protein